MRPADRSAGAVCSGQSHDRVKQGHHGVDPNDLSVAELQTAQRQMNQRLARMGVTAKRAAARTGPIWIAVRWHVILRNNGTGNVSNDRIKPS